MTSIALASWLDWMLPQHVAAWSWWRGMEEVHLFLVDRWGLLLSWPLVDLCLWNACSHDYTLSALP